MYRDINNYLLMANSVWKKPIIITEWGIDGWRSNIWKGPGQVERSLRVLKRVDLLMRDAGF